MKVMPLMHKFLHNDICLNGKQKASEIFHECVGYSGSGCGCCVLIESPDGSLGGKIPPVLDPLFKTPYRPSLVTIFLPLSGSL